MAKPTVASLSERVDSLESQIRGLESALRAIPMGTAPQNRTAVVQGRTIFRDPETVIRVTCAQKPCVKFAMAPRGEVVALATAGTPWCCPAHRIDPEISVADVLAE